MGTSVLTSLFQQLRLAHTLLGSLVLFPCSPFLLASLSVSANTAAAVLYDGVSDCAHTALPRYTIVILFLSVREYLRTLRMPFKKGIQERLSGTYKDSGQEGTIL